MESPLASNGPPSHYNGGAPYHTTAGAHEDDFGPETDVDGESAAHVLKALKEERNASQKETSSSEHALNLSSAGSSDSEGEEGVEGGGWDFVQGRGKEPLPLSVQTSHKVTNFDSDSDDDHLDKKVINQDDDLDDMNHPLNPDAAEFVPVTSPVKSPTSKLPWDTDNGHHEELKHDIENGFDKKSFAGNGVDLIGTDSNGLDIHHALEKNHHGVDIHKNGDNIDHNDVEKGHAIDILDAQVDRDVYEVENDEVIACSPKKPKKVIDDEDDFFDDIKQRPSSGFEAKENGDHENDHHDLSGFETLDVSKTQATMGDSTINYMADLSTTMASPHHGNLLSEDFTTSSLSPSSPHGAADSQASNPFDNPTWTDRNETNDFDRHTDFEEKHNDFDRHTDFEEKHNDFGNNESVEKTIENNETNGFSSDFTGANSEDLAVETSAKVENSNETLLLGEENVHQEHNLEDVQVKHEIENEVEASKKDAIEDQFDKLDIKPSAPFDPADNVKADDSNIDFESYQHTLQEVVEQNLDRVEDVETTDSVGKFDTNTFNEFHTATDQTPTSLSLFTDDPPPSLAAHSVFSEAPPLSLAGQIPLNYAEETYQTMLDTLQTPNPDDRRISCDLKDAYNAVAHSLDTPAVSKDNDMDFNFDVSNKKESEVDQQEESAELQPKQEMNDESHTEKKEEFGVNEHIGALNGSYVEESHVESREIESVVEQPQENESQLGSEQLAESERTGDNEEVKAEQDLHQTLQTEEFEFHREDNATSASTLDESINEFISKQEQEGNVETVTMGEITPEDFLSKHDAFVEQNTTQEDNVNEIVRDTNIESIEVLNNVEANVTEAVKNVSESIQEEEEVEEIQIGKTVSNLNESDVMSQSFYGNYDEEPARSPSPEEMIDHYEKIQQEKEHLAADESSKIDSSVEAGSELTPTTETTTLEAKLAQENTTTSEETKQPEEEQKTSGQLFEISHEEISEKSAQEKFDDLTFGSKTSESSFQQEIEEVVEQSAVPALETNLDDVTPQETKIESEFLENTKDAEAKEEVSGPNSLPDVVSDTSSTVAQAAAAVGAAAVVGAAAAVAAKKATTAVKKPTATSATKNLKSSISKSSTAAKPLAKTTTAAKPAAKPATTVAAKKPATTAVKSTLAAKPVPAKPAAPKPSTTTAAKPAPIRRPVASTVTKTTTTGVSAAPKPAAAKPAPKPGVAPAPKPKPAATTATKPLTNGVAKRPVTATSTAAPRTSATKPAPPTKPIAPRVPLSQRTSSSTSSKPSMSSTVKKTSTSTTTTAPPARKPLSSVTSKVGSNLKPKVGAAGTKSPSSSNAIKKTETKTTTSSTATKSAVTKPVDKIETPLSPVVDTPVMTNGH